MSISIPQTWDEAMKVAAESNYKTTEDINQIIGSESMSAQMHLQRRHIDAIKDAIRRSAPVDCGTLPPGHKCFETACIDNIITVLYCNGSKGCTRAIFIPC
jgi:hypothetical protein